MRLSLRLQEAESGGAPKETIAAAELHYQEMSANVERLSSQLKELRSMGSDDLPTDRGEYGSP